eukprot:gnl/MRDRNA2_/MRDRNA2_97777_c0_seq1.p1 gnl/MRDRNA2_/MRDRNA2_97777_c0~~gnl/MRDRNA2_/MRDRNA2_97777_c0_seq1.p1  ORF type:complete len:988 (+),score=181.49 gnl/MRDRNA2_/MRDRNA2_97777_c0_seq1:73-3036(+)
MDRDDDHNPIPDPVVKTLKVSTGLQVSIFPWIQQGKGKKRRTISAREVAFYHGIPRGLFRDYVRAEIAEANACLGLPFTLLMVASYAFMAIAHDNAPHIRAVEDSIDFDIQNNANFAFAGVGYNDGPYMGHKDINDVNSIADFWSWMVKGFVPLVFQQSRGFHEGHDYTDERFKKASVEWGPAERGRMLFYNRIVGGVRMRQERSGEADDALPCNAGHSSLLGFYAEKCVHGHGYELDPEMMVARVTTDPKRHAWLYVYEDMDVLQDKLLRLEASAWLDRNTRKIEIAFPVYNAEFGLHTLMTVNFFFSRGGHIHKKVIPFSNWADWHDTWYYGFYDGIWIACLLYILVSEIRDMRRVIKANGFGALYTDYLNIWNVVDWSSVGGGVIILGMFGGSVQMTKGVNDQMVLIGKLSLPSEADRYNSLVEEFVNLMDISTSYIHKLKLALALYPLVIIFRLFKAFSAQPRLAVVTKTMKNAMSDLLHFMLVFCSVFISFVIAGVVLFGREVSGFVTFPRAMNSCFRLMLGDIDWDTISEVGRMEAGFWMWCFFIIVVLLMLNMLLAIVMDHYCQVKESSGNAETLWQETVQTYMRWKGVRKGLLVPLEDVLAAFYADERKRRNALGGGGNKFGGLLKGAMSSASLGMAQLPGANLTKGLSTMSFGSKNDKKKKKKSKKELAKEKEEEEAAAERTITFDEDELKGTEEDQLKKLDEEVITADDIMRMVSENSYGAKSMGLAQTLDLMSGSIMDYHEENKSVASMQEVLQLTRKVSARTKSMKGFMKSTKPKETDIDRFSKFSAELQEYVDDVLAERARVAAEIEQLVAVKQDLLSQLSQMPGEQWRQLAGDSAAAANMQAPKDPRRGPEPPADIDIKRMTLPMVPQTGPSRPIAVSSADPYRFVDEPVSAYDDQWEEDNPIEEDQAPLAPNGSSQYASVNGGYRDPDQQSQQSFSQKSVSQASQQSGSNNGYHRNGYQRNGYQQNGARPLY